MFIPAYSFELYICVWIVCASGYVCDSYEDGSQFSSLSHIISALNYTKLQLKIKNYIVYQTIRGRSFVRDIGQSDS